jgi:hypothetical protein
MNSNIPTTAPATGLPPQAPTLLDINAIDKIFGKDVEISPTDMDIVSFGLRTQSPFDVGDLDSPSVSPQVNPSSPLGMASHTNDSVASFLPASTPINPGCSFLDASNLSTALAFPADMLTVAENVDYNGSMGSLAQNGGQKRSKLVLESVSHKVMTEILQVIFISNSQVKMSLRSQTD